MQTTVFKKSLLAFSLGLFSMAALAQSYPTRAVKFIVPYPAGSTPDALTRIVSEALAKKIQQSVVVENKPGAGGMIGAKLVSDAPGDGNTLLVYTSAWSTAKVFQKKPPVSVPDGLQPVTMLAEGAFALAAAGNFEAKSFDELVRYAQAKPSVVNFANTGLGDNFLYLHLIQHKKQFKMEGIQYKGSAEYVAAMLANDVQVAITPQYSMLPLVRDGKLNILAVSGDKRSNIYPNAPTFAELNIPEVRNNWFGIFAPKNTSAEMVEQLNKDLVEVIRSTEVTEKIQAIYFEPSTSTPQEFQTRIAQEMKQWSDLAQAVGLQPQ